MVNVKDFCAFGNGSADDTAAIQAAIDSIRDTGGVVYFPAGTYMISTQIALKTVTGHTYNNITLLGDGYASQIKASAAIGTLSHGDTGPIVFQGLISSRITNSGLRNIRLTGFDETTQSQGPLVSFDQTDGCFVIDSYLDTNRNEGIYFNNPTSDTNGVVRGNYITRVGGWGDTSGGARSAYNINCSNITMTGNRSFQTGLAVEQTGSGGLVADNVFEYTGLNFGATAETALSMSSTFAGARMIIRNNTIRFSDSAISYSGGGGNVGEDIISGNLIENCNNGITVFNNTTPVIIKDNYLYDTISGSQGTAIAHSSGSVEALIEGNVIALGVTPWATAITCLDPSAADIVRNNVVKGAAVTGNVFQANDSNAAVQFIENIVLPGGLNTGRPRYRWQGVNYTKTAYSGIDNGTILSTVRPSVVRHSAIPVTGTWAVGDVLVNMTPSIGGVDHWVNVGAGTPGSWGQVNAVALS